MARPTKLNKELLAKAANYLDVELKMGGLFYGDLPTVAGLSIYLDVSRETICAWGRLDSPDGRKFSDTLSRLNSMQEYKLIGKRLKGEYTRRSRSCC